MRNKSVDMYVRQMTKLKTRQQMNKKKQLAHGAMYLFYILIFYHIFLIVFTNIMAVDYIHILTELMIITLIWMFLVMSLQLVGIYGALAKRRELLFVYASSLLGTILINCVLIIIASYIINSDKVAFQYKTVLFDKYTGEYPSPDIDVFELDRHQIEWKCCGIRSYHEYEMASKWKRRHNQTIPRTCCILKNRILYYTKNILDLHDESCTTRPTFKNSYIEQPCKPYIVKVAELYKSLYYTCVAAPLTLQFLLLLVTLYVRHTFQDGLRKRTASQIYLRKISKGIHSAGGSHVNQAIHLQSIGSVACDS